MAEEEPGENGARTGPDQDGKPASQPKSASQRKPDDNSPKDGDKGDGADKDPEQQEKDRKKAEKKEKAKRLIHNPLTWIVAALVVVAILVAGFLYWRHARKYVSTDDAFIDARIVHVAPQISGLVTRVYVTDNQFVRAGQPLLDIDASDARVRTAQAQAARERALAQIAQAEAQIRVSQANLAQAQAQVRGAEADAVAASHDQARFQELRRINAGAASLQQVDQAVARAAQARSQRDAAVKQTATRAAEIAAARTQIGTGRAALKDAEAQIQASGVALGDTRLYAAVDGHVTKRTVAVGSYLQPGEEVLALVPLEIWVTANFKETQLRHMQPGQRVTFEVDAYKDLQFTGHVDSIQRGAGQAFALLPAQNATGNYVKVVQRVPVKIVIDRPNGVRYPLGPGMSVKPRVKVLP